MTTTSSGPRPSIRLGSWRGPLLINALAPFATYEILTGRGVSELTALAVGALFPLAAIAVSVVRTRRLDPFAAVALASIAVGLTGGLVFDSPRILLVKDSIITAAIGLAFLGSLFARRPLIFVFARRLVSDPAALDQRWSVPDGRRRFRTLTLVWGVALVAEATVRVGLSFILAPGLFMVVSPLLAVAVFSSVTAWTLRRRRTAVPAQNVAAIAV
jgi:intracellular septation protein A